MAVKLAPWPDEPQGPDDPRRPDAWPNGPSAWPSLFPGCSVAMASTSPPAPRSFTPRPSVLGFSSSGPLYWAGRATLVNRPEDVPGL